MTKNLTAENDLLKKEIESLNSNLEILSAKINQNGANAYLVDEDETNSIFSNYFMTNNEQQANQINDLSFKSEINSATSEEVNNLKF